MRQLGVIGTVLLGAGALLYWRHHGSGIPSAHASPEHVTAPVTAIAPSAKPTHTAVPARHYSSAVPAPPVTINREGPKGDNDSDYKVRQEMIARYDEWKRETGITVEQEAKVLSALANAQANYLEAYKEAHRIADEPEHTVEDFGELFSGEAVGDDLTADLRDVLTPKQLSHFQFIGLPMTMFSPLVGFLTPSAPQQ